MKAKIIHDSQFGFVGLIENEDVYERFRNDKVKFKKEPKYVQIPYKVFKKLIGADKKQIPKKVEEWYDENQCGERTYLCTCPSCDDTVCDEKNCPNCGQALDWS